MITPENWGTLAEAVGTLASAFIIAAATAITILRGQRAQLAKIANDARAAADQTTNSHEGGEYPNLREELTATREGIRSLARDVGGLRADIRQLHDDQSEDRKALRAHIDAMKEGR